MMYPKHLFVGGLVAMGFDPSGKFLLTVTHSGRGVFATETWERVARDPALAYPDDGKAVGIGPIDGQVIDVQERDERREQIVMQSPDGRFRLLGESEGITISEQGGAANRSQPVGPEPDRKSPAAGSGG
jgi:hypothetical protein